jgi:pimeloyl-ACP methyl ester carboxylesterase
LGYIEGRNLFIFHYDWRLSNFETAQSFQAFIETTPQLRGGKLDIVAHSMGGILTRIYLQQYGGAAKVRKVIYLGTPFLGAMSALATLSNGWGTFANRLAGGLDNIRNVILSLPAFYELFPRYESCCRIGSEAEFESLDILSYQVWEQYNWMPTWFTSGQGAEFAKANFDRAAKLRELLRDRQVDKSVLRGPAGGSGAPPRWRADGRGVYTEGTPTSIIYPLKRDPCWRGSNAIPSIECGGCAAMKCCP